MYENTKKWPSDIFGLRYNPDLQPNVSNDDDRGPYWQGQMDKVKRSSGNWDFSEKNTAILTSVVGNLPKEGAILEIGVTRCSPAVPAGLTVDWREAILPRAKPTDGSSTATILGKKELTRPYLGVDLNNNRHFDNPDENISLLQCSSFEREMILWRLLSRGITSLALLYIDGYHSINAVMNDWFFSRLVPVGGFVVMHDTNVHPGPYTVYEAVDARVFMKKKYFTEDNDWGMAVLERIR